LTTPYNNQVSFMRIKYKQEICLTAYLMILTNNLKFQFIIFSKEKEFYTVK